MKRGAILGLALAGAILTVLSGLMHGSASGTATPAATVAASPAASPVALAGNVEAGKTLSAQCTICHSTNGGVGIGPSWKGLYGSKVELADGTTVIADEAYLIRSIKDPSAQTVKGFATGTMPQYGQVLTDQQIADLVAYIETLSDSKP